ncbi:MAG: hypothetical protein II393_04180 [Cytophagales bacterium]|nr:hypothetical protein [Cytophagales bacterium]
MYELSCRYDSRKSFYGKAKMLEQQMSDWREIDLYSYDTLVAKIVEVYNKSIKYICYGKYSQTTTRHQKEFFRQYGLDDKQIEELFKNGTIVKNFKEV